FLATVDVVDDQLAGAADDNQVAIAALHRLHVVQVDGTVGLDLYAVVGGGTRCGTTDMEGTHRQLGTRLTDRLCSDHAHGLTDVGQVATREVTAVAETADAVLGGTGDGRTHQHFVDTVGFQNLDQLLVDHFAGFDDRVAVAVHHVACSHTAQYALAECSDDVATLDDR